LSSDAYLQGIQSFPQFPLSAGPLKRSAKCAKL
jgi:hypothetical protein